MASPKGGSEAVGKFVSTLSLHFLWLPFRAAHLAKAVSLQITGASSSVLLGEEYANLKMQSVMPVSAFLL